LKILLHELHVYTYNDSMDLLQLRLEQLHRQQTAVNTALKVLTDIFVEPIHMTRPLVALIEQYRGEDKTNKHNHKICLVKYCETCRTAGYLRMMPLKHESFDDVLTKSDFIVCDGTLFGDIIIGFNGADAHGTWDLGLNFHKPGEKHPFVSVYKLPAGYRYTNDKSSLKFNMCLFHEHKGVLIRITKEVIFTTMVSADEKNIGILVKLANAHKPSWLRHELECVPFYHGKYERKDIFRMLIRFFKLLSPDAKTWKN
jgi:hypothetical protein